MRRAHMPGAKPGRSTEPPKAGELGLNCKAGYRAPVATRRRTKMGGINAAIEVGKHELKVCLGSEGELFSEPNQASAINRIIKRLSPAGCMRVLIEGGSYQSVLIAALRAASSRW
jgi:hypothetical protein